MKRLIQLTLAVIVITFSNLAWSAEIETWKTNYTSGSDIWIELIDRPGNYEDWIGIYPAGSTNDWGNVVEWVWARNTTPSQDAGDWYKFNLADGQYEARFFLNNSFDLDQNIRFTVGSNNTSIKTWKKTYTSGSDIWVELINKPGNYEDWIGIYPAGSNNDWGNVVDWVWAKNPTPSQDAGDWYKFKDIPDGHYETRFFLNNTYKINDTDSFTVESQNNYASFGDYENDVTVYDGMGYSIAYMPENKNHPASAPIVLYITGASGNASNARGLLEFMASKGNYVIAISDKNRYNEPNLYAEQLYQLINESIANHPDLNIDTSKIGVIGHSAGGGDTLHVLKYLKNQGYASNSNFVISLDGWFDWGMSQNDMKNINTTALLLQFGGADGVNGMEDPRINRTIYNRLEGSEKAFSFISTEDHLYVEDTDADGNVTDIKKKTELLSPIGAMLAYKFKGDAHARNIALRDRYDEIVIHYDNNYYYYPCMDRGFNYCQ